MEVGEEGNHIPLTTHHHQNNSCIKMGSDESHFNVSLIVRDKVIRRCLQTTTLEEKGEPKQILTEVPLLTRGPSAYQLNALLLGQIGSLHFTVTVIHLL